MQSTKRRSSPDSNKAGIKKSKQVQVQSNTLFNYFASNKKFEAKKPEPPQQSSILNFFKRQNSNSNEEKKENLEAQNSPNEQLNVKSESVAKHELIETSNILKDEKLSIIKTENTYTEAYESESVQETSTSKTTRKCPFYKRIEGIIYRLLLVK
jgi:hypothetical protein